MHSQHQSKELHPYLYQQMYLSWHEEQLPHRYLELHLVAKILHNNVIALPAILLGSSPTIICLNPVFMSNSIHLLVVKA